MSEALRAAAGDAPPVRARGLVKRYKEVLAVDHIDLNVDAGDVYGFLGPNGAGKTTTLRMCLGLIMPSEGTVELFGRDPLRAGASALEGVAGFVEAPRFYPYLTGRKNLELLAALDGDGASSRIAEVLDVVELTARGGHRVGGYSHGMRQRLGIAAALLRAPRLLLLDEPATGLDPAGMRDMRALIRRLADEGITVLLSSHQLPEVQELCDRVAIVHSGRVVYEGALADLRRQGGAGYRLRSTDDVRALTILAAQPGVEHAVRGEHGLGFQAQERDVGALTLALGAAGIGILALTPELATLEDLFFRLTEGGQEPVLEDLEGSRGGLPARSVEAGLGVLATAGPPGSGERKTR
ncbi:MAG TPA: ATP-binding cassette domain-containing protein [Solirubrobacteraceae bacterium]